MNKTQSVPVMKLICTSKPTKDAAVVFFKENLEDIPTPCKKKRRTFFVG